MKIPMLLQLRLYLRPCIRMDVRSPWCLPRVRSSPLCPIDMHRTYTMPPECFCIPTCNVSFLGFLIHQLFWTIIAPSRCIMERLRVARSYPAPLCPFDTVIP